MLRIGEFSRVTGLTVKTIRLYHEEGLLPPAKVGASGYRYYDAAAVERALAIIELRRLDFPLAEIREILAAGEDDADLTEFLERRLRAVEGKLARYREVRRALRAGLAKEKEAAVEDGKFEVEEKVLEPMWIAGIRVRGRYAECSKLFGRLGRTLRSRIRGKPMNLYHDGEYKEEDADFEPCFPVAPGTRAAEGISVRELAGGRFLCLLHRGPYEELGRSYRKLFEAAGARGLKPAVPSREVYLKGPGMIFRGNPKRYLTEIQIPVGS